MTYFTRRKEGVKPNEKTQRAFCAFTFEKKLANEHFCIQRRQQ